MSNFQETKDKHIRAEQSIENKLQNKPGEDNETHINGEQIRNIMDLLNSSARSITINFDVSNEFLSATEKIEGIVNTLSKMSPVKVDKEDLDQIILKAYKSSHQELGNIIKEIETIKEEIKKISQHLPQKDSTSDDTMKVKREHLKLVDEMMEKQEVDNDQELPVEKSENTFEPLETLDSQEQTEQSEQEKQTEQTEQTEQTKQAGQAEQEGINVKGFVLKNIPIKISAGGKPQIMFKRAENEEDIIKECLRQLREQGLNIENTSSLRKAGLDNLYSKFRSLGLHKKYKWKQWIRENV